MRAKAMATESNRYKTAVAVRHVIPMMGGGDGPSSLNTKYTHAILFSRVGKFLPTVVIDTLCERDDVMRRHQSAWITKNGSNYGNNDNNNNNSINIVTKQISNVTIYKLHSSSSSSNWRITKSIWRSNDTHKAYYKQYSNGIASCY